MKKPNEIYLFGDVNSEMAYQVVGRYRDAKDLTAYLMTDGGDLSAGIAIYDEIRMIPNSTVICTGIVASSGIVIMQAFKNRKARLNTHFVVHEGRSVGPTDSRNKEALEYYFNSVQFDILSRRMGVSNTRTAIREGSFNLNRGFLLNMIDGVDE